MRISIIKLFLVVLFLVVAGRLFYWQIIKGDELRVKAEGQLYDELKSTGKRGDIYFADEFVLASSKPSFLIYGLPKILTDQQKQEVATILAKKLKGGGEKEMDLKKDLVERLSRDLFWVPLGLTVDFETKKALEILDLKGVGFDETSSRFYPEGSSSAHLLGFVGKNARGEGTGYFGLEGHYNGELKGVEGRILFERDALGLPILTGRFLGSSSKDGRNLVLNVDRTVQFMVEGSLKRGLEKYGAKKASAIVMDPKTGAILAMASFPNYDPSSFEQFSKEVYTNAAVAESFEPGSTFKVLVMASALNEKVVEEDTICDSCSGPVEISGFSIKTWDNKYYPHSNMVEVIVHSDNTGMVFVGKKLGMDKFYSYLDGFGFGKPTGVDLQDESSPALRSKDKWREIDLITASFGQGIAVTPIQMVSAVASLANGGYLMQPQMVKKVKDESGVFEIKPKTVRKVVSSEAAQKVTEMMVKAVDEGEARFFKPKGFKIAGKTGTAQIPIAGHYDPNKTIASFVGFAPAENPRFVMLIIYEEPTASIFGSETAAPTFFEIAKQLLTYFKIAPSE